VTFSSLTVGSYVGDVKLVYETGYGIMLSLYNDTTSSWMYGATVTSSAARRGAVIAFAANVPADGAGAAAAVQAQGVASMLVSNPQAIQGLTSSITIASARLLVSGATSTAVTAPLASDISAAAPVIAATGGGATSTSTDDDNSSISIIVVCVIGGVILLVGLGFYMYYCRGTDKRDKLEASHFGSPGTSSVMDIKLEASHLESPGVTTSSDVTDHVSEYEGRI